MAFKVFVSNDVSEKGVALLREHFDVDVMPNMPVPELCKIIGKYDALVSRSQIQVTKELIDAATNLKVIGRAGVGVDNIDIPAATARLQPWCCLRECSVQQCHEQLQQEYQYCLRQRLHDR